jgi:hypothetical protein
LTANQSLSVSFVMICNSIDDVYYYNDSLEFVGSLGKYLTMRGYVRHAIQSLSKLLFEHIKKYFSTVYCIE